MQLRMWRNWFTSAFIVEMCHDIATLENSLTISKVGKKKKHQKNLNMHLPYRPAIALPDIYPREVKTVFAHKPVQECSEQFHS